MTKMFKIQFKKDKYNITWNLVRTNIQAYGGYAFSYVMPYDQNKRPNLLFTKEQVNHAIAYFESHNRKNIANKIKHSLITVK